MSIQAQFDNEVLAYCPKIAKIISEAESFEANQMLNCFLKRAMNSSTALYEMSKEQIALFECALECEFKFKKWVKV